MNPLWGLARQSRANHSRLATARRVARLFSIVDLCRLEH